MSFIARSLVALAQYFSSSILEELRPLPEPVLCPIVTAPVELAPEPSVGWLSWFFWIIVWYFFPLALLFYFRESAIGFLSNAVKRVAPRSENDGSSPRKDSAALKKSSEQIISLEKQIQRLTEDLALSKDKQTKSVEREVTLRQSLIAALDAADVAHRANAKAIENQESLAAIQQEHENLKRDHEAIVAYTAALEAQLVAAENFLLDQSHTQEETGCSSPQEHALKLALAEKSEQFAALAGRMDTQRKRIFELESALGQLQLRLVSNPNHGTPTPSPSSSPIRISPLETR